MNIVFVIDTYNDSGGGSIATKRLVNELKVRGHNVKIICAVHENQDDPNFFQVPGFLLPIGGGIQGRMNFLLGKNQKNIYRKAMQDADIVQIQFPFLMAKGAVQMARKMNIPVIGAFHVQPQNLLLAIGKTSKIYENICWILFKYFLFNRVDTIVSPSVFASKLLVSKGIKANHISISNGITNKYVKKYHKRPKWFEDRFVIINIGRYAHEKRQELIIEGIRRAKYGKNIQLIIAGKGELAEKLMTFGKMLPVKPHIEYICSEDKLKYLNTADLYIHASNIELDSLSTSEAIGCGLPCLISNSKNSAASQFAIDSRFLFDANDADDLALKIDYWYENREELKSDQMKSMILNMASKYQISKSVDMYEELYLDILSKHTV